VADVFEDRSGTLPIESRPGLQRALEDALRLGAGTLIVEDRSRLARDEYAAHGALHAFKGSGIRIVYADGSNGDGDDAQLIDSIQHAIAAADRRRIVARLRAGREVAAETVRRIFELTRSGASLAKIASAIEGTGAPRRSALADLIRNETYKRDREGGRIVDPRIWNLANAALDGRRKRAS